MKTFKEVKEFCEGKIKEFPELEYRYKKEVSALNRFFKNNRNIIEEFEQNKNKIDNRYVIPFLLGFTSKVDLEKPLDMIQVKSGASGGREKNYATLSGNIK